MGNPFGNGAGGDKGGSTGGAQPAKPPQEQKKGYGPGDAYGGGNDGITKPPQEQKSGSPEFAQQVPAGGTMPFKDPGVAPGTPQVGGQGPKPFKLKG
jgi:hypothetical protein